MDSRKNDEIWVEALEATDPLSEGGRVQVNAAELRIMVNMPIACTFVPNGEISSAWDLQEALKPIAERWQKLFVDDLADLPGVIEPTGQTVMTIRALAKLIVADSRILDMLPDGVPWEPITADAEEELAKTYEAQSPGDSSGDLVRSFVQALVNDLDQQARAAGLDPDHTIYDEEDEADSGESDDDE